MTQLTITINCPSPYLGKTYGGMYDVKKIIVPQCDSSEQFWATGCPSPANPIGFFFDDPNPWSWNVLISGRQLPTPAS